MKIKDLYDSIQNPLDDKDVVRKIISAYANTGFFGFYDALTSVYEKNYDGTDEEKYYKEKDVFYINVFNRWKKEMLSLSVEDYKKLYENGRISKDFPALRSALLNLPEIKTYAEMIDFLRNQEGAVKRALDKYSFTAFGAGTSWEQFNACAINRFHHAYEPVEHRLYINVEQNDIYRFANILINKFSEANLPYYFKFDGSDAYRNDVLVIYSSTRTLEKYINILLEIKKEYPEIVNNIKHPTVLSGVYDGWIGYGSEPIQDNPNKQYSFNTLRSDEIEESIELLSKNWMYNNRNKIIVYNGRRCTYQDYLCIKCAESWIEDLQEKYLKQESTDKEIAKHKKETYKESKTVNEMGYTLADVQSDKFRQYAINVIKSEINKDFYSLIYNGKYNTIKINARNNIQLRFNRVSNIIRHSVQDIEEFDPTFLDEVKKDITTKLSLRGVDPNKICFDTYAVKKINNYVKQHENSSIDHKIEPIKNDVTKVKEEVKQDTTVNTDLTLTDVKTLLRSIDPVLLNRPVKLPTGVTLSARQYLETGVFPHLPKSGLVVLSNGAIIPVKQFIEDNILRECQNSYNGDYVKYITERTRENVGIVSIEYNNQRFMIPPINITSYINPEILNKEVKLPNGTSMVYSNYIQGFFAPHIRPDGRVILKSGEDISVIKYIEEILINELPKYNGDLSKVLFNTTRANLGIINTDPDIMDDEIVKLRNPLNPYNRPMIK